MLLFWQELAEKLVEQKEKEIVWLTSSDSVDHNVGQCASGSEYTAHTQLL
jgi:hypothetical protein